MRKATLLAMAVAIAAISAIPSTALSSWTKHHESLASGNNVELELTGTDLVFETEIGGVTCSSIRTKILFEGGTTRGRINSFEPEGNVTSSCQGTGLNSHCDVHEAKADGLPWLVYISSNDTVTIKTGALTTTLTGTFCPHTLQSTPGTLTLTVAAGETNTTSIYSINGELPMDGSWGNFSVEFFGSFDVLGTITYGVGEPGPAPKGWTKDHGFNLFSVEREITGTDMFFETEFGGVTCASTISKVLFESGTTGTISSFEPEGNVTSNCQGRSLISQCDVHEAKADNLPWTLHTAAGTTVTVTTGTITTTLSGFFCPHTLSLTPDEVHFQTTETNTTSTATLESSEEVLLETDGDLGNGIETEVRGTVHVLGTITYGI